MSHNDLIIAGAIFAIVIGGVIAMTIARRRREERDSDELGKAAKESRHLPASLHPVIDPDICIGSLSCIRACPEGDILGIVDGAARLVVGANCIGHGRCALECPVSAIKLVFGTSERGVDLPHVDAHFESSRPGVHIVGELGGMGLIRNAMTQGLQVAEHLAATFGRRRAANDDAPVVIVGAGPAGIATALGCQQAGVPFRMLEQGALGGTVSHFPRHKIVMTEKIDLPGWGKFGRAEVSKEELLGTLTKIVRKRNIAVEEGVRVTGIEGDDGRFTVKTSKGDVAAKKVVLAIGRRGTPRTLGAPGEDSRRVTYSLVDPEQYVGKRVLVVGGGDSALEAACALAEQPRTTVGLSYRGPSFNKCREANRRRVASMAEHGRLQVLLATEVARIDAKSVELKADGVPLTLENDYIIACLGGELPSAFLAQLGISLDRHSGEVAHPLSAHNLVSKGHAAPRRLAFVLAIIGVAITLTLAKIGWRYYTLPAAARLQSPLHEAMRPAGVFGHGIGIFATLVMLSNFLYAARKRWGFLKGAASIRPWLTFHVFVGLMAPIMIAFHAAFQSRNLLATSTYLSLMVVVVTGIVGRFVYGLTPVVDGKPVSLAELRGQLARHQQALGQLASAARNPSAATALLSPVLAAETGRGSLIIGLLSWPLARLRLRAMLSGARRLYGDAASHKELTEIGLQAMRVATQVRFYSGLRRLLSGWRAFHVVLAVLLLLIIAVHVGFSLYLGYTWIFA